MSAPEPHFSPSSEIAHVLFMDLVAYSALPTAQQHQSLKELNNSVRDTAEFARASAEDQLIRLPTGDGMALVFFRDPEAPVRCALELSRKLCKHPEIKLRMGIHTGPVYRVADINANLNVAGGGINVAQRVMDCGDPGHILVSKATADVLNEVGGWKESLRDLGELKVKHGVRLHLFEVLKKEEAGQPQRPRKLRRVRARQVRRALVAALLLSLAAGAVSAWLIFGRNAHALTSKDTIVLSDFDNKTGDAVFDDTLRQGLSIQLEQSPFLSLISERKANQALKLMGRHAGDPLTPEVTRQVCQRTGSKAMLSASIAMLGSQYVIGLKAVNCQSGDVLAEAQSQAEGKEGVLKALDVAAVNLRTKLGESLSTVQVYAAPLADATTPSLEALKAFSLGQRTRATKGATAAIPFYKRAIELDPHFAEAYRTLGASYRNLNEAGLAVEYARKAYDLREKVSERERFSIDAFYYQYVTGELEKAAQTFEAWQQTYPRNFAPYTNLGVISFILGNYEKSLNEYRQAQLLEPNNLNIYVGLGLTYISLNRLDESEQILKQAEDHNLQGEYLFLNAYELAFLKGDASQLDRLASSSIGKAGSEDLVLALQADTQAWYGKLKNGRELTRRAMDSAIHNDAKESAAGYQVEAALREVEAGKREEVRADANAALKLAPNRDVRSMAALVLARAGDTPAAENLEAELTRTFPLDTLVQRYWLPSVRAAVALEHKDPSRAVDLLKESNAIELGQPTSVLPVALVPVYLRGEAYLALHDGNRAAAEFQKFMDHRGVVINFSWGALARLGLARASALEAQSAQGAAADAARAKARASYQDFLALWKDADPDIPILKEAKAEYAKLQ